MKTLATRRASRLIADRGVHRRPGLPAAARRRARPVPGQSGRRADRGVEAASLADQAWWEILEDRRAARADRGGPANANHDVRLAAWRVEEARANAGIARSEFFPQVQGSAGWTRGRGPSS